MCPYPPQIDERLHAGTAVLFTRTINDGSGIPVKNHWELKAQYEKARQLGLSICITFINDHVTAATIQEESRWCWREWSKEEHLWIGKCRTGFDGGADLVHRSLAAISKNVVHEAWHFVNQGASTGEEEQANTCYSINEQSSRKRIRFAESYEYRTYSKDSLPTEFILEPDGKQVQIKESVPLADKAMPLGGTLQAFLHWLENGGLKHVDTLDKMEHIRKLVKQEIYELAKQPNDQNQGGRKADLEMRDTLLKIHANALHLIQLSKSLKDWARFQISIGKIDEIKPQGIQIVPHSNIVGEVFFIFENGRAPEASIPLPCIQLSPQGEIVYDNRILPYQLNYNSVMTKSRALEIRLSVIGHNGKPVSLGKINIPLSKMHQFCHTDQWQDLAFHAEPNHLLASGRVCLHGRRVALDPPDYVEKKHEEALRRMKTVINWITRFRGDIDAHNQKYNDTLKSMGADVKIGNTNMTLLHAGTYKLPPYAHYVIRAELTS